MSSSASNPTPPSIPPSIPPIRPAGSFTGGDAGRGSSWWRSQLRDAVPWFVIPVTVALLLRLTLIGVFVIPSASMEPTLPVGDRLITVNHVFTVNRGDIIVFKDPGDWLPDHGDLIKRVIAVGGDHVYCEGAGHPILVNGKAVDDSHVKLGSNPSDTAFDVTVPDGHLWVMGDNRSNSADSRIHGFVPENTVIGVAKLVYWPLNRIGAIQ